MSDAMTMTQVLTEMAAEVIGGEQLDGVQWFYPGGRWNTGPMGMRRWARIATGRRRLDDGLPTQSVLIVTATRVIVYTAGTSTGRFALHDLVGEWGRPLVSATARQVELTLTSQQGRAAASKRFKRLTLLTPDGELVADLPERERATVAVARALHAA